MKLKTLLLQILISLIVILFLSLFISFFVKGCQEKKYKPVEQDIYTSMKVDDKIDLKTINNETVVLQKTESGFLNVGSEKNVLISFFTTNCAPCNAMIPHLNNLQKKYKDNLTIISVLLEPGLSHDEIDDFYNKNSIEYIVTFDKKNLLLASEHGNITDIPSMFIYDKDGKLLENYIGAVPEEMIEADLTRMF